MKKLIHKARRLARESALLHDERGLSTVEYVILLVLVAVLAIGGWTALGGQIRDKLGFANDGMAGIPSAMPPAGSAPAE